MSSDFECPRCQAELTVVTFGAELVLCCPRCGFWSLGLGRGEWHRATTGPDSRAAEELWRRELALRR